MVDITEKGNTTEGRVGLRALFLRYPRVSRYLPIGILFLVILLMGFTVPYFLTGRNMISVLRQASALGLMAIGMTIVLIAGGIDISIPAVMALSGILGSMYMLTGVSPIFAVLLMVVIGTALGTVNGFAVAYLRLVPFVATLSMMAIATGASVWLTKNISVAGFPLGYIDTIMGRIGFLPVPVLIVLIMAIVFWVLMKRSYLGRWLYAVGINPKTAEVCGIPRKRVIFGTYALSGFFAGMAAVIVTARLESASATMGDEGVVLNVIGSAVVGGASIYGGIGNPIGAAVGAVFIVLISNSMTMMHIPYHTTLIVKGLVIIVFVAFDSYNRRVLGSLS
jgi:ribose/xylose/arabinose/galactoside ABC-type transport system permease subunit